MNPARIDLALVFEHLEVPFDLATFSKRFNVQKKIYLSQLMGMDLGYRFRWYLSGPYSPALTADAFMLQDEVQTGDKEFQAYKLHPETEQQLNKAKKLWRRPAEFDGSDDEWLELLASLHYLLHIAYRPKTEKRDFASVFPVLVKSKPHFDGKEKQAKEAWQRLKEIGLIEQKTLA